MFNENNNVIFTFLKILHIDDINLLLLLYKYDVVFADTGGDLQVALDSLLK